MGRKGKRRRRRREKRNAREECGATPRFLSPGVGWVV